MFLSYHGYKTQCSHCSALFNLQAYPLSGFFVPDSLSVPIIPYGVSDLQPIYSLTAKKLPDSGSSINEECPGSGLPGQLL